MYTGMGGHLAARRVRGGVGMEVEKEEFDFQVRTLLHMIQTDLYRIDHLPSLYTSLRGVSLRASGSQIVANVTARFSGSISSV
jgi:hypothetical protein